MRATIFRFLLGSLNRFYDVYTGGARRPVVFDIDAVCPQLRALERHWQDIRAEVVALRQERAHMPRYHELDAIHTTISIEKDPNVNWRLFYLYSMGEKPEANRARCPKTSALLDNIPGLFQAFYSVLEGGKSVPAHEGPYRGYLRYHLGLVVPKGNPPSIRIGNVHHTWKEGESFFFDDSWDHEVFNSCPEDRIILIVDIARPMPQPFALVHAIAERVMCTVYARPIMKKLL